MTSSSLHFPDNAANRDDWPPNGYDWTQPTVVVYQDRKTASFTEEFATAREKLDYGYHQHLALPRQLLQDTVLKRITVAATASSTSSSSPPTPQQQPRQQQQRPWMIFTAGAMGAGKGYCLAHLSTLLDLPSYVQIDPDKLKQELPELAGYIQTDPATASTKLHPESSQMADILLEHALQSERPILIDGSLRDVAYYTTFFQRIRRDYPSYRLAILHVTADAARVRQRAEQRARHTGRVVPPALLQASIEQVPRSVDALAPYTDAVHVVANNETLEWEKSVLRDGSTGEIIETIEQPGSWERLPALFGVEEPSRSNDAHMVVAPTMEETFACPRSHAVARRLWQSAYPNTCIRCALACDGQCGLCPHGNHLCSHCTACERSSPPPWEEEGVSGDDEEKN